MFDKNNSPYGFLDSDSPVKDMTASEIHRIAQTRPKGYRPWTKVRDGADKEVSGRLRPIVDGADVNVEEHNESIIEGLFVAPHEESKSSEEQIPQSTIDLNALRARQNMRKQPQYRESISPVPPALDDTKGIVENVIPIKKRDIQESHEFTEDLSKVVGDLTVKHLGMMLSFDNASAYVEAFAKDGLDLRTDVQIADDPMHFLSNLCSIETLHHYIRKTKLPRSVKASYMEKVTEYFFERGKIEAESARKSELLRRYNQANQSKGHVEDDSQGSPHGTIRQRR
jgi:hypothetical protein